MSSDDVSIRTSPKGWYSTTPNPVRSDQGLNEHCLYCLTNFRQYHPMINNICQSCGRVAEPVMRDDQENIRVTSLNAGMDNNNRLKGIAMEIDYSPSGPDKDPSINSGLINQRRMTANSIGEATEKLRQADLQNTKMARAAALMGQGYIVKTNIDKDAKKRLFDNNNI
jgi:hypothetical protein